jgi:hypothetical protein
MVLGASVVSNTNQSSSYLNQHSGDGHYVSVNTPDLIVNDLNGRSPIKYTGVVIAAGVTAVRKHNRGMP